MKHLHAIWAYNQIEMKKVKNNESKQNQIKMKSMLNFYFCGNLYFRSIVVIFQEMYTCMWLVIDFWSILNKINNERIWTYFKTSILIIHVRLAIGQLNLMRLFFFSFFFDK